MGTLITFKDRSAEDYINKQIIEVFRTCEGPDVDLIVTGGKVVSAHRVILSMYSKYLRRILSESNPEPKFVVPLKTLTMIGVQYAVELFYYGEIRIITALKNQVKKALDFLEVDYCMPNARTNNVQPQHQILSASEANKIIAAQNAKSMQVGAKPMQVQNNSIQVQNKPNPEQQAKPNGVTKPKPDAPAQSANSMPVNRATVPATEKSIALNEVQSQVTTQAPVVPPVDKSAAPLSLANTQLTEPATQFESMQTLQNNESTALSEKSPGNSPVLSDISKDATAAKPAPEVEKLDENIAARLLNYDVDKAAEQLHSQMDEFMKELDGMADTEHNAAHDMDIDTSIQ